MIQLIRAILRDPEDYTRITLISCQRTEQDLLLHPFLESLAKLNPEQLVIHTVLSKPSESWTGPSGHVNREILENLLPASKKDSFICVCGTPGFYETVSGGKAPDKSQGELGGLLKDMGYQQGQVFKI